MTNSNKANGRLIQFAEQPTIQFDLVSQANRGADAQDFSLSCPDKGYLKDCHFHCDCSDGYLNCGYEVACQEECKCKERELSVGSDI